MKILVATDKPFAKAAVDQIRKVVEDGGHELALLEKYTEPQQLYDASADVDAMIVRSDLVTPEVVQAAKNLKIVVRAGAGYDNINLPACTEKGIVVMNTPGQNSNAVAELAFGMMVSIARGQYDGKTGSELRHKKIGIHAYGNVGKYVAKIARGFGMEVYAYDPFVNPAIMLEDKIKTFQTVEELYMRCDYISLHIPANDKTKKSIGYDLVKLMPKGGTLVNTARKEVINEEGLLKIMNERTDLKYVSDIQPDALEEFNKLGVRVFFTPKKMGAQTEEANINSGIAAARQIVNFFKTGDKTYQVNK